MSRKKQPEGPTQPTTHDKVRAYIAACDSPPTALIVWATDDDATDTDLAAIVRDYLCTCGKCHVCRWVAK